MGIVAVYIYFYWIFFWIYAYFYIFFLHYFSYLLVLGFSVLFFWYGIILVLSLFFLVCLATVHVTSFSPSVFMIYSYCPDFCTTFLLGVFLYIHVSWYTFCVFRLFFMFIYCLLFFKFAVVCAFFFSVPFLFLCFLFAKP